MFERATRIGRLAGIEIHVHWTILLGILYFVWTTNPRTPAAVMVLVVLVVLLFGSILLHELAHVLVARRFGIATRRVVLWALGGAALFDRQSWRPREEVLIVLAGPLANLGLAGGVALAGWGLTTFVGYDWDLWLSYWLGEAEWPLYLPRIGGSLVRMNMTLVLFNLLPIYPLDGGRLLRAAIRAGLGEQWANRVMLAIGIPAALAMFGYFAMQQQWLSVVTALLLLLAVATLHPRANQQIERGFAALFSRGDYYMFYQHDFERAIQAYERILASNPRAARAFHNRGAAATMLGQHERALADFERALALTPDEPLLYRDRGHAYSELGEHERARADLDRAHAMRPDEASIAHRRYHAASAAGDPAAMLVAAEHVVTLQPTIAESFVTRGYAWHVNGDDERALADLNHALTLDARSASALVTRSVVYLATGDYEGALADSHQAITWAPTYAVAFNNRGYVYSLTNRDTEAFADLDRAIQLAPRFPHPLATRAKLHARRGEHQQAFADFAHALQLAPRFVEPCYHRAALAFRTDDHEQAHTDARRALELDAREVLDRSETWLATYLVGRLDWALQFAVWATEQGIAPAFVHCWRGDALRMNGSPDAAIAAYTAALSAERVLAAPTPAALLLRRSQAYEQRGDRDMARDDLHQALAASPTPNQQRQTEALLSQLEPAALTPAA
jgi:tetratricopeptide (TPR) repeat protein